MAYVPGFEYDIFLSYASDDLDDKLRTFFNDLRISLRRDLGKEFSDEHGIFLDRNELKPNSHRVERESSRHPQVQRQFLFLYFHPRMPPPNFAEKNGNGFARIHRLSRLPAIKPFIEFAPWSGASGERAFKVAACPGTSQLKNSRCRGHARVLRPTSNGRSLYPDLRSAIPSVE
jgi:hypothetical protein